MQQFDAFCPTELDENVLAFDVTQISEPRPHCVHAGGGSSSGAERQVADARYFGRLLLRPRRERPRRRHAAEERDELATFHVGHGACSPALCQRYHGADGRSLGRPELF